MKFDDISRVRLVNQQLSDPKYSSVKDLVGWMGALQAQDYDMAKLAIGLRLLNPCQTKIDASIEQAEIIRTHVLRPTWHFVSSDDIYWMLKLSAPQIKSAAKSRDRDLGITDSIFSKSNALLEKILSGGKQLTRPEIIEEFKKADIDTGNGRLYHLFMRAEIEGIIFSRDSKGNRQTYSLLREVVPETKTYTRDEALANLANRYFNSHGPATVQDFAWWSGLSVTESKKALEMNLSDLNSETIENQAYWFSPIVTTPKKARGKMVLLPAFDEFVISYKDRKASASEDYQRHAISSNGIFRPVIVVNGQVIGIWKRTMKKDKMLIHPIYFQSTDDGTKRMILSAVKSFEVFFQKHVEIVQDKSEAIE